VKRWIWISIAVFVLLIIGVIITVRNAINKTDFDIESAGVDANINSWADVQTFLSGEGAITIKFLVYVKNTNWFKIPLRDLESRVYYRGQLIGNSAPSALKNIDIAPGSYKQWIEPVDIHAKGILLKEFLGEILTGSDPVIKYETELKVLGIRYTYSDQLKIVETALSGTT